MGYNLHGISQVMLERRNALIALRDSGEIDSEEYQQRLMRLEDMYYDSVDRQYALAFGLIDREDGQISIEHDGVINAFQSSEEAIDFLVQIGRIENVINF